MINQRNDEVARNLCLSAFDNQEIADFEGVISLES